MNDSISNQIVSLEALAMSTPGVIGIAEGVSSKGEPCIKLLTSVQKTKDELPNPLQLDNIEIEYIGTPKAQ